MMRTSQRRWTLIAAVAAAQTAVLAWMVADRITLLRTGREVVMEVTPVDPRSLFRGDYVILSTAASRIPGNLLPDTKLTPSDVIYVTLARKESVWAPVAASLSHPGKVADDQIVLKGRPSYAISNRWAASGSSFFIRYGIESYFVPEGKGRDIETLVGEKKVSVILSVSADGTAAIKGLIAEGKTVYDEPLL